MGGGALAGEEQGAGDHAPAVHGQGQNAEAGALRRIHPGVTGEQLGQGPGLGGAAAGHHLGTSAAARVRVGGGSRMASVMTFEKIGAATMPP